MFVLSLIAKTGATFNDCGLSTTLVDKDASVDQLSTNQPITRMQWVKHFYCL